MTPKKILEELVKRNLLIQKNKYRFVDKNFSKQAEVITAYDNRFKAIQCTRRAGKSNGEVRSHLDIMETFPGSKNLYGGITLDSVHEICWDIFLELDETYKIGLKENKSKRSLTHPNGSKVRLFGVDASEKQMRKILGQGLRKVSLDEAGSITINMKRLCYQMIMPALADFRPHTWLTLLGTPENIPNTFFQQVTDMVERFVPWKVFKWTAYDNPYMQRQWESEIKDLVGANPLVVEASWFRTHYLNEWCTDEELQIIKIAAHTLVQSAIEIPKVEYDYILGVDLGYNDANSFSIVKHSYLDPIAYIIKSFKKPGLDLTDVANIIKKIQSNYRISKIVIDGTNKQGVEEMRKRHGLPLEAAEKIDKILSLRMLQDEINLGTVKLVQSETVDLQNEWNALIYKDEQREKEDDRCENHCSDSTLYAYRETSNYSYTKEKTKPSQDSDEYMDNYEKELSEKILEQEKDSDSWLIEEDV